MKPIDFPGRTTMVAESQDEYQTLPAYQDKVQTISLWRFSWKERLRILFGSGLWIRQMNFGTSLQPLLPQIGTPFTAKETE